METIENKTKKSFSDEEEIRKIFDNALKDIDPEIIKTLEVLSKIDFEQKNNFEIINSFSGTSN